MRGGKCQSTDSLPLGGLDHAHEIVVPFRVSFQKFPTITLSLLYESPPQGLGPTLWEKNWSKVRNVAPHPTR